MPRIHMDLHIDLAHKHMGMFVKPDSVVIDATLGNGYDTEFLLSLIGENGEIHAFDVQPQAFVASQQRLKSHPMFHTIRWHERCHSEIPEIAGLSKIDAAIFNLGYLPGADHETITHTETTIKALDAILERTEPGAALALVCYTGHEGGVEEYKSVMRWCAALPNWVFMRYERLGHELAPVAIVGERRK